MEARRSDSLITDIVCEIQPKFHYTDFPENFHVTRVTGKFRGFKPSRHVEMVWKIPATSRHGNFSNHLDVLRRGDGEIGDVRDKSRRSRRRRGQINGDVTGLSRTCRGRHGEVGIVEFRLNAVDKIMISIVRMIFRPTEKSRDRERKKGV